MSVYLQHRWPVQDLSAICKSQNIAAAGSAIFNGTLATSFGTNQISFINNGFSRVVSITSANNLSGNTFVIVGSINGALITEDMTGPNNGTVYGVFSFDVILSITVNNASNAVSIGSGNAGYLPLINLNLKSNAAISWAVGVFVPLIPATGITYQGYLVLDNIANNLVSFDDMGAAGSGLLYNTIFPANQHASAAFPTNGTSVNTATSILIHIVASTRPITDVLTVSFLQN